MRLDPKGAVPHAEFFFSSDRKIGKILELKKKSSVNWTSFASFFLGKIGQILDISKFGKFGKNEKKRKGGGASSHERYRDYLIPHSRS